ncbi:MAG: carboxynorspermidine decarboxylase [Akkermansia sp.]
MVEFISQLLHIPPSFLTDMPAYMISATALEANARVLRSVADASGCRVVLALKGFSTWGCFDVVSPWLDGCCASGIWEAKLAHSRFGVGKHVLTYSPAYTDDEVAELLNFTNHLDFNSVSQWERFKPMVLTHDRFLSGDVRCGLRVNPQCSTGHVAMYDPCVVGSRLGVVADDLDGVDLTGISGLHIHTLCEQGADDLDKTVAALELRFGNLLKSPQVTYLNLGGGHWITQSGYDRDLLVRIIRRLREQYGVEVWLEPGEAVAIHSGVLRCRVLDVTVSQGVHHAIVDVSASAHMPDVLEMPYRPDIFLVKSEVSNDAHCEFGKSDKFRESDESETCRQPALVLHGESYVKGLLAGEAKYTYRLGASTCLAGDVIGDFSFPNELKTGDELVFDDMAHYTTVKTSFFNGVRHPDLVLQERDGTLKTLRRFEYRDFESRLG